MTIYDNKTDIRILKFLSYTSRNPDNPFGYYCLGRLYLDSGYPDRSLDYFRTALAKDKGYVRAKIGILESLIVRKKYYKAVRYYEKNSKSLNSLSLYKDRVTKIVSASFDRLPREGFSSLSGYFFKAPFSSLIINKNNNPVYSILLCIYFVYSHRKTRDALEIYKLIIRIKALNDNLRWKLLELLSQRDKTLAESYEISSLFENMPCNCSSEYANKIFEEALLKNKPAGIHKVFRTMYKSGTIIKTSNLWRYVYWNTSIGNYDSTVYQCCKRLISAGWIDRVLASALSEINRLKIASVSMKEMDILRLYGYVY